MDGEPGNKASEVFSSSFFLQPWLFPQLQRKIMSVQGLARSYGYKQSCPGVYVCVSMRACLKCESMDRSVCVCADCLL